MFNMNYAAETLSNVREVLWNIKERGGMVNSKFIMAEVSRLQGQRAEATLNIALVAMGKQAPYPQAISQSQLDVLVARASRENGDILRQIADLRTAKGK